MRQASALEKPRSCARARPARQTSACTEENTVKSDSEEVQCEIAEEEELDVETEEPD